MTGEQEEQEVANKVLLFYCPKKVLLSIVNQEWSFEVGEEGMGGVFGGEDGGGGVDAPVDAEAGVEDGDAAIGLGGIVVVAFILEYGNVGEDGEAMGEATGDEELALVVFGEFHGDVLAICGGAFADIDGDVEHVAAHAADKFGLGEGWALEVEAAHHAAHGAGFIVLNEFHGGYLSVEVALVVGFKEIAAGVGEDARLDYLHAGDGCVGYCHCLNYF